MKEINPGLEKKYQDLKTTEEDLTLLNERFSLATRSARLGVWDWYIRINHLVWDDQMYQLYGVEKNQFTGAYEAWVQGLHPDDRDRCNEESMQALAGEMEYKTSFRVVWPDGTIRYLHAEGTVIRDAEGSPVRMIGINFDITDSKRAETLLAESESRFRSTFDNMLEGTQILDSEWRYLYINRSAEIHNRRPKEDLLGRIYADMWPGVESTHVYSVIRQCLEERVHFNLENKFVFPDGLEGWFDLSIQPIPAGVLILSVDISGRKRMEQELRSSEEKFSRIFFASPDGIALSRLSDKKYLEVNDVFLDMIGYSREEVIGNTAAGLHLLSDWQSRNDRMSQVEKSGMVEDFETEMTRRDQTRITIHGTARRIEINGEMVILSILRDITHQKLNERYEKLSNELLVLFNETEDPEVLATRIIEKIQHSTGIEAVAIRLSDGLDFPYYKTLGFSEGFVNAERYLCNYDKKGNPVLDENGEPLLDCMCGNILCGRVDSTKSFFTRGGSFVSGNTTFLLATTSDSDRLARTRNRCNSTGYQSVALIPIRSRHETIGLLQLNDHRENVFDSVTIPFFEKLVSNIGMALTRNLAELRMRRLNQELEQRVQERTAQLQASNKELEAFSYSVSHDLRSPLRGIDGWSQALLEDYSDRLDEQGVEYLNTVRSETKRMGQLIDDMLKLSQLTRADLVTTEVNLSHMVTDIAGHLTESEPERHFDISIQPGLSAFGDPRMLEVAMTNLLANAVKFTSQTPLPRIEFGKSEINGESFFFIRDNGAGFDMAYSGKLFGAFQRMHTAKEFPGTGVGLAIVQRVVHRHGGRIWADARVNHGATFFFTLKQTLETQP